MEEKCLYYVMLIKHDILYLYSIGITYSQVSERQKKREIIQVREMGTSMIGGEGKKTVQPGKDKGYRYQEIQHQRSLMRIKF